MNSEASLLSRLLKGFPVKIIKEEFDITGLTQSEAIDGIVTTNSRDIILNFVHNNFNYLRQHVYVFDLNRTLPTNWRPVPRNLFSENTFKGYQVSNLIFNVKYNLINVETGDKPELIFLLPVQVWVKNRKIIIKINTLERNANDYFEDRVFLRSRDIDDDAIILGIKNSLPAGTTFVSCDLNRGIKSLLEDDFIDLRYVKFKKSSSTATETMDEEFTLKNKYPDLYREIIATPLEKTVVKLITDAADTLISHFNIEAGKGRMAFVKFPKTNDALPELIELILSAN